MIAALEVLANISHTASEAIPLLKEKFVASGIHQIAAFRNDALHNAAVSVTAPIDQGFFDADVVRELEQQTADLFLVDQIVERSDKGSRSV